MDCSPPGSSVHGIFQAKVLEWVAIAFSEHKRYNVNQLKSIGFKMIQVNLNPQSISQQTHPEVAGQLQGMVKRGRSGWFPNGWYDPLTH